LKLRSKTSSIENQASLWLVTCSDLFFLLFGFFVLNHTLPHEEEKGTFEVVESLPALRDHLQETVVSEYAAVNLGKREESNLIVYSVTQKWFTSNDSLSLYGNTQLKVLLEAMSSSSTSAKLEIQIPKMVKNKKDFESVLRLKSLIETQSNKKISMQFKDEVSEIDTAKFILKIKY